MELTMEQCCKRLENMDDIAVLCHRNPDGDTLGRAFALNLLLRWTLPMRSFWAAAWTNTRAKSTFA